MALVWLLGCVTVGGLLLAGTAVKGERRADPKPVMKAIEDIKVGDWVLAKDPNESGLPTPHRVIAVPRNWTKHVVHIQVDGGELQATRAHPFWVPAKGWVAAKDLHAGDVLCDDRGRAVSVTRSWTEDRIVDTFNLTVDGVHTYYALAGNTPVLVHNVMVVTPGGQAIVVPPNAISMDQAVEQAIQHAGPGATMGVSGSGGYQFVGQPYTDPVSGNTMRNIGRLDTNLNNAHVQEMGGPHLNLEVQRNSRPIPGADPHTPIDPNTIRPGDCP